MFFIVYSIIGIVHFQLYLNNLKSWHSGNGCGRNGAMRMMMVGGGGGYGYPEEEKKPKTKHKKKI